MWLSSGNPECQKWGCKAGLDKWDCLRRSRLHLPALLLRWVGVGASGKEALRCLPAPYPLPAGAPVSLDPNTLSPTLSH